MVPSVVKMRTNHGRARSRAAACAAAVTVLTAGFLVSTAGSAQAIATEVPLGTAEAFAVLAYSGITNTGTTTIDGDIGSAPTESVPPEGPIILIPPNGNMTLALAIRLANETDYGLTAGIFSEDDREIDEFFNRIQAGVTYANRRAGATTGAWPGINSFGGWKASGSTGRGTGGPYYVQQFMREQSRVRIR